MFRKTPKNTTGLQFARLLAIAGFLISGLTIAADAQVAAPSICWERVPRSYRLFEEFGKIADLKDKHTYAMYPDASGELARQVVNELAAYPALKLVSDLNNAEFLVQVSLYGAYEPPPNKPVTRLTPPDERSTLPDLSPTRPTNTSAAFTGSMTVFMRGKRYKDGCYSMHYVWVQRRGTVLDPNTLPLQLPRQFIRDLEKVRGEK